MVSPARASFSQGFNQGFAQTGLTNFGANNIQTLPSQPISQNIPVSFQNNNAIGGLNNGFIPQQSQLIQGGVPGIIGGQNLNLNNNQGINTFKSQIIQGQPLQGQLQGQYLQGQHLQGQMIQGQPLQSQIFQGQPQAQHLQGQALQFNHPGQHVLTSPSHQLPPRQVFLNQGDAQQFQNLGTVVNQGEAQNQELNNDGFQPEGEEISL